MNHIRDALEADPHVSLSEFMIEPVTGESAVFAKLPVELAVEVAIGFLVTVFEPLPEVDPEGVCTGIGFEGVAGAVTVDVTDVLTTVMQTGWPAPLAERSVTVSGSVPYTGVVSISTCTRRAPP